VTTISVNNNVVTLINVFTVEPENQQRLMELLTQATERSVSWAPGFVSASLHRSTDGAKVTMYAQWQSMDHYRAMRQDPAPLRFFQEALTIAKFDPRHPRGGANLRTCKRARLSARLRFGAMSFAGVTRANRG
jgi:quinol monooxygenase YgiN